MTTGSNPFTEVMSENSLGAAVVIDSSFQVIASNRRAQETLMLGSQEPLVGRSFLPFVDSGQSGVAKVEELLQKDFLGEAVFRTQSDRMIFVQASVKQVPWGAQKVRVISFHDISLQKKIQRDLISKQEGLHEVLEELTKKNEELIQLDQAKTKFLSLVAHELRTPLNAIISISELLNGEMYSNDQERRDLTATMYSQCEHLRNLVNDILDLTKIQSGKMEYFLEKQNPGPLVEEQVVEFVEMARGLKVMLETQISEGDHSCYFDSVRMKQIIANLLSNAIKFNREGGKVVVNLSSDGGFTKIQIKDSGIGIPSDKLQSIFNQFETIENISNHHKGTGLGLPLVKSMIESQGGTIEVESQLGKGSTFILKLPQDQVLDPEFYRSRQDFGGDGMVLFDEEPSS